MLDRFIQSVKKRERERGLTCGMNCASKDRKKQLSAIRAPTTKSLVPPRVQWINPSTSLSNSDDDA